MTLAMTVAGLILLYLLVACCIGYRLRVAKVRWPDVSEEDVEGLEPLFRLAIASDRARRAIMQAPRVATEQCRAAWRARARVPPVCPLIARMTETASPTQSAG